MNTATLLQAQSNLAPLLAEALKFERCARMLDLEDWVVEQLRHCEQEINVNFLVTGDNGEAHSRTGIFARHCSVAGKAAVPFAVSREAFRDSVCADAMRMTWLCSLYGVQHGGGAAALVVDPEKQSEHEMHRAVFGFAEAAQDGLSSVGLLIPAGVHGVEMDWLAAGLEHAPGTRPVITGKASTQSVDDGREELALGLMELIRCVAGNLKLRIAVQGFDENIRTLLFHLQEKGTRLVAVADSSGGLKHELGLDLQQLDEHVRHHGALLGYSDAAAVLNSDVLQTECDVLILVGGDRQIHEQNVSRIAARVVIEVAPGAVTEGAAHQLSTNGKVMVSNLLASGPWLLRAAAEAEHIGPGSRRVAWIRRMVRDMWRNVVESQQRWNTAISEAAQALAIQRVSATLRAKGTPL